MMPLSPPSKWEPEPDVRKHQALGKLAEELAELSTITARMMIQGVAGKDPKTGKENLEAWLDEAADVIMGITLNELELDVNVRDARRERFREKLAHKRQWLDMLAPRRKGEGHDR
jgi:hypothetical protein